MKAHIPNSAFLHNINTFLSGLDTTDKSSLQITANPDWISIHPLVLSILAALGKQVDPKKITCEKITARSGHYITRMGLFDSLNIPPQTDAISKHEPSGILIPLRQINDSDDLSKFLTDLVPLLHLQDVPKQAEAIQHIFSELIRNTLEHSDSPHGAMVCAQYFKRSNKIAIGVADVGIGLRQSLRRSYTLSDDTKAIQLALTPGITGTTVRPGGTEQNAGFGLFLIKSIALVNSDFFTILSGDKMYKLLQRKTQKGPLSLNSNPFDDRHNIFQIPNWNGVAIGVDISLDQTKEFSALLDLIHNFYSKSVGTEKQKKYKKPQFI